MIMLLDTLNNIGFVMNEKGHFTNLTIATTIWHGNIRNGKEEERGDAT
jgi:hypothetical protein